MKSIRYYIDLLEAAHGDAYESITLYGEPINAWYNTAKNLQNLDKHERPLIEGVAVLEDPNHIIELDERNFGENRDRFIGMGPNQTLLVVIIAWLDKDDWQDEDYPTELRIVSVRLADQKDINKYMKQTSNIEESQLAYPPDNPPIPEDAVFVPAGPYIKNKIAKMKEQHRQRHAAWLAAQKK